MQQSNQETNPYKTVEIDLRKAAKSLKGKRPLKLVYQEEIGSHSLALKTEAAVKKWPKEKKESLVKKKISLRIQPK